MYVYNNFVPGAFALLAMRVFLIMYKYGYTLYRLLDISGMHGDNAKITPISTQCMYGVNNVVQYGVINVLKMYMHKYTAIESWLNLIVTAVI